MKVIIIFINNKHHPGNSNCLCRAFGSSEEIRRIRDDDVQSWKLSRSFEDVWGVKELEVCILLRIENGLHCPSGCWTRKKIGRLVGNQHFIIHTFYVKQFNLKIHSWVNNGNSLIVFQGLLIDGHRFLEAAQILEMYADVSCFVVQFVFINV